MSLHGNLSEYFCSFQGEGLHVGKKQFFLRFSGCNITHCRFCDTVQPANPIRMSSSELIDIVLSEERKSSFREISLTGGEPLLQAPFIRNTLEKLLTQKSFSIYLETNATLPDALSLILPFVHMISADYKLSSVTGQDSYAEVHKIFFEKIMESGTDFFIKAVINDKTDIKEFTAMCEIIAFQCPGKDLVLQPETRQGALPIAFSLIEKLYDIAAQKEIPVRIIPQTHIMLNFR